MTCKSGERSSQINQNPVHKKISEKKIVKCRWESVSQKQVVVVGVATGPLPRDGRLAEDHGAPEAGKLSRV